MLVLYTIWIVILLLVIWVVQIFSQFMACLLLSFWCLVFCFFVFWLIIENVKTYRSMQNRIISFLLPVIQLQLLSTHNQSCFIHTTVHFPHFSLFWSISHTLYHYISKYCISKYVSLKDKMSLKILLEHTKFFLIP